MRNHGKRWLRLAIGAMVAGAVTPAVLRWVRRAGAANRAVDMRMTLVVERPVAEVFEFCRDFANFPEIVDVLLSVEDFQDGRSHWAVRSPTGQAIEWDAIVTKYVPNSVIAWESVPRLDRPGDRTDALLPAIGHGNTPGPYAHLSAALDQPQRGVRRTPQWTEW
jgi:uncharacterized membrane protein